MAPKQKIDRRQFLRNSSASMLSLPMLNYFLNGNGTAFADGSQLPFYYVKAFFGMACGFDGYSEAPNIATPKKIGFGYDFPLAMQPFVNHNLQGETSTITGLRVPNLAVDGPDAKGAWSGQEVGFHPWAVPALMRGGTGASPDMIVADAIGKGKPIPDLHIMTQASFYLQCCVPAGRDTISWRANGAANPPISSPMQLYNLLVSATAADAELTQKIAALNNRRSILDFFKDQEKQLLTKVGSEDRAKLQKHFAEIRALERRLEVISSNIKSCSVTEPASDPAIGGNRDNGDAQFGGSNEGSSNETERRNTQIELLAKAFECDLTSAVSWQVTMAQCFMDSALATNLRMDFHGLGHSTRNLTKSSEGLAWHLEAIAGLAAKLKSTPVGGGTLLDRTVLVATCEGGIGGNASNPQARSTHSTENMTVWLVGGSAGGHKAGQHVIAPSQRNHPLNVDISAMKMIGVEANVGDVSGVVDKLFTT